MSASALRALSKHSRSLSRTTAAATPRTVRAFHSPFIVLQSESPITAPPTVHTAGPLYEKQLDHSPEPIVSATGARTYVVSEPDPSNTPYEVPSGAFPTSAPYQTYTPTNAPVPPGARFASTSNAFAHPLSRAAPQNKSGVMESSAVRYGEAPGEMGARGGGHGGIGLMDAWSTTNGEGELELADRNPPPLGENAEKFSKLGVDNAWKERK
ncbi:hypothetical protein A0H81_07788 [Grifola frondosa]|uniref:Uncharacterized protein n=1 Tax=Grifola frondosa TaxID=5627 RepID=A0A1C7M715_GRIFR|nr:hypothetical protein A0H81_07788 [Grifola frondosa]